MTDKRRGQREFDFTLVLRTPSELTDDQFNALVEAGCDDATVSIRYGAVQLDFARSAKSLKEAVLTAIRDIRDATIGAEVAYVAECTLVTQSEIARRIDKSRQFVHQLTTGVRGPGRFPPPTCHINDVAFWSWCAVSLWLFENAMIRTEVLQDAELIAALNASLELVQQNERNPKLMEEVREAIGCDQ